MVKLTNFSPPTVGIHCEQPDVEAYMQRKNLGHGKLYVAESRLSWVGNNNEGFSLEYTAISVHGVSRDRSNFPHECIYMMINGLLNEDDDTNENISEETSEEEAVTEIHLVPQDGQALNLMFQALSTCSALHPDEDQSTDSEFEDVEEGEEKEEEDDDDDEEDGGEEELDYETSAAGLANLSIQGQENLQHLETIFQEGSDVPSNGLTADTGENGNDEDQSMETGQFDDADN